VFAPARGATVDVGSGLAGGVTVDEARRFTAGGAGRRPAGAGGAASGGAGRGIGVLVGGPAVGDVPGGADGVRRFTVGWPLCDATPIRSPVPTPVTSQ